MIIKIYQADFIVITNVGTKIIYKEKYFFMNGNKVINMSGIIFRPDLKILLMNLQEYKSDLKFQRLNKTKTHNIKYIDSFEFSNNVFDSCPEYFI